MKTRSELEFRRGRFGMVFGGSGGSRAGDIWRWSAVEVRDRIGRGERLLVLDVRETWEREVATIPVAPPAEEVAIAMGEIPGKFEDLARTADGRTLVVYCHHGVRSLRAARWLAARGLAGLANLDGGIDAWSILVDASVPRY